MNLHVNFNAFRAQSKLVTAHPIATYFNFTVLYMFYYHILNETKLSRFLVWTVSVYGTTIQ
jgi:hypothetical protein